MIFVYVCMVCRRRSLFFVKMWKFPTIVNRIWLLFFLVFEFPIFFSHCFADGTDWFDTFFSHCISKIFFCWFYLSPDYICMKCVIWFENRKSFHSLSFFLFSLFTLSCLYMEEFFVFGNFEKLKHDETKSDHDYDQNHRSFHNFDEKILLIFACLFVCLWMWFEIKILMNNFC